MYLLTGILSALVMMTLAMSVMSTVVVAVLICTPLRGRYYACIWSTIALVTGLLAVWPWPHFFFMNTDSLPWPGALIGGVGLYLWFNARHPIPPVIPDTYAGPRCVSCRHPIATGTILCPSCGWTQPETLAGIQ